MGLIIAPVRSSTPCSTRAIWTRGRADTFVSMYVNEWTLDYGDRGRAAVRLLLDEGHKAGIIPHGVTIEFVGDR